MSFVVVIPARYQSTRLPGKPLADIHGKPMIQWVAERALQAGAERVIVATDDQRVANAVALSGVEVCMTSPHHQSGTERLAEVCKQYAFPPETIIVNVQGDEPLIDPDVIDRLAQDLMDHEDLDMATVATPLRKDEYEDPSAVKVVVNQKGEALYFSRSLIPFPRHEFSVPPLKHVGIYAYRRDFLLAYAKMEQTPLEKTESLEQLRALEMGYKIGVIPVKTEDIGIDTEADLKKANEYFERNHL